MVALLKRHDAPTGRIAHTDVDIRARGVEDIVSPLPAGIVVLVEDELPPKPVIKLRIDGRTSSTVIPCERRSLPAYITRISAAPPDTAVYRQRLPLSLRLSTWSFDETTPATSRVPDATLLDVHPEVPGVVLGNGHRGNRIE